MTLRRAKNLDSYMQRNRGYRWPEAFIFRIVSRQIAQHLGDLAPKKYRSSNSAKT